jgi:hypothetical protein
MAGKTDKRHIRRKKVTKENELTQEMVSRIVSLHELGMPPEAIRLSLYETCHANVSFRLINRATNKIDHLVEEWLNRLRRSIAGSETKISGKYAG